MKNIMMRAAFIFGFLLFSIALLAQSPRDLKSKLNRAKTPQEKMEIQLALGKAFQERDNKLAVLHTRKAFNLAEAIKHNSIASQSAFLLGQLYNSSNDSRNEEQWLKTSFDYAKKAKENSVVLSSVNALSNLYSKKRDFRNAYQVNQDALDYFSQQGGRSTTSSSSQRSNTAALERETEDLRQIRDALEDEIQQLNLKKNLIVQGKPAPKEIPIMSNDNLSDEVIDVNALDKEQIDSVIMQQEEALASLSEAKEQAEKRIKRREREIQKLKRADLERRTMLKEQEAELAKAALETEKSQNLLKIIGLGSLFLVLLAIVFYSRYRTKKNAHGKLEEKNKIIEEERLRSDELLLNILPADIAKELKENGKAKAQKFNDATVLLADFKNFTAISEKLTPEQLVKELDYCFRGFDFIISQYEGVEKIKTIGDAYMCASGLGNRKTIPVDLVKAALEMQEFLEDYKRDRMKKGLSFFEARIGIHTGPVVAGVVGINKFAYDIWGDTVNIASRLESKCEEGKVNISSSTYNKIKYKFDCDYRGKINAKNKGQIDMYYVKKAV